MRGTLSGHVVRTRSSVVQDDIAKGSMFPRLNQLARDGIRSCIAVLLISKGSLVGTFSLSHRRAGVYGARERRVLERLASQVAPAMENARLFEELQSSFREQASINRKLELELAQRERAEERLRLRNEELEALQGKLLSASKLASVGAIALDLTHQIKNPLAILVGRLEGLRELLIEDSKEQRYLNSAMRAVDRIRELTKTFGSISKQKWVPLDIRVLLEEAHVMTGLLNHKKIETHRDYQEGAIMAEGNPALMREAFSNIFSNSMEAIDSQGHIYVQALVEDASVVVRIRDDGIGIPDERMGDLFEPFRSSKPNGYGLGLFAAKHITEMHLGSVGIESVQGEGTCVTPNPPKDGLGDSP